MAIQRKEIAKAAEAFVWAAGRAFQLGLQAGSGGNISIRLGDGYFLTKPTGKGLVDCSPSDLLLVDSSGKPAQGYADPTKEIHVHLSLFEVRPEIQAVVHYHAPYATAFASKGMALPLPTVHARRILKRVPLVPEYPEGSRDLADAVRKVCEDKSVTGILMINHGLMAVGGSVEKAQYCAELMEESARIGWLSQAIPPGSAGASS